MPGSAPILVRAAGMAVALALLALAGASPARAGTIDVDVTCLSPDQVLAQGNVLVLPRAALAGDTLRVAYHGCSWVSAAPTDYAMVDAAGLQPNDARGVGFDLPDRDGVALMSVVGDANGGDSLVWFRREVTDLDGMTLVQPFRAPPRFTLRASRSPGDCRRVTVTLVGIPSSRVLRVNVSYLVDVPSSSVGKPIGDSFEGAGGTGSSWSHTYRSRRGFSSFPREAFRLTVFPSGDFFAGIDFLNQAPLQKSTRVAAC